MENLALLEVAAEDEDEDEDEDDVVAPVTVWLKKLRQAKLGAWNNYVQSAVDGGVFRQAVLAALKRKNMSMSEAARRAGMRSPSALANFLASRSQSLRYGTSVRLAQALDIDLATVSGQPSLPAIEEIDKIAQLLDQPGAPVEVRLLMSQLRRAVGANTISAAPPMLPAAIENELLMVRINVDEDGPRENLMLPVEQQEARAGRMSLDDAHRLAFGARIVGRAAEPVYPPGTILVCAPVSETLGYAPVVGRRVLACYRPSSPRRWRRFTVAVFQVERDEKSDGLVMRLLGREGGLLLEMPERIYKAPWTSRGFDVKVTGVVTSSIISEEG